MAKIYFTLTGTQYYHGKSFLKPGMKVLLEKEPDNKYDKEAIMVKVPGLSKVGYVANSYHTVLGDSISAGRLYDKIGRAAKGKVVMVTDRGVICKLSKKSIVVGAGEYYLMEAGSEECESEVMNIPEEIDEELPFGNE